jgi:hypothetical protein
MGLHLSKLLEGLPRSLLHRSPSDSNALIEEAMRHERIASAPNLLNSIARSHLRMMKLHNHYRAGETEQALHEAKAAMALSPYDPNTARLYVGLLTAQRTFPATALLLIVSCKKRLESAMSLAARLQSVPNATVRIAVSRRAQAPASPALMPVDAADHYESLPLKVRDALVQVFETYAPGTCVFKMDDDLEIDDFDRFAKGVQRLSRDPHPYVGDAVPDRNHDRAWHFKKCADAAVDTRPYGKRFLAPFAKGPFYFLSARARGVRPRQSALPRGDRRRALRGQIRGRHLVEGGHRPAGHRCPDHRACAVPGLGLRVSVSRFRRAGARMVRERGTRR